MARKQLDIVATLERYRERNEGYDASYFHELENAYLSTFDIYCTITDLTQCSDTIRYTNAAVLMEVARKKGVNVLGITSERKTKTKFVCPQLYVDGKYIDRDEAKILYVGRYNFFTSHSNSKYRVLKEDKVAR